MLYTVLYYSMHYVLYARRQTSRSFDDVIRTTCELDARESAPLLEF